ncbi:hypothetical protein I588_02987 [Enterococcus pallens ATCC BAA-351]|uniref:O-antigen ligase-related domain-containing protein n=1 Tax=Enterococcus pallens ATCC BAA-351 TaxID=1158607 RepID=R2RWV0_9ENTE|nr:hypothetical protein UAU_04639 [Enterococcus pallens ATCC BAA-351]EOU17999.1 hypothetical protein I588_02987 [Enterococcus pallens ATCC BAA-351]
MWQLISNEKFIRVKEIYLQCLLMGLVLRAINFVSLLPSKYDGAVFTVLAAAGSIILFIDLIKNLLNRKFPYDKMLVFFVLVIILSTVMNRRYGMIPNLKLVVWSAIYYFLAYQFGKDFYKNASFFKKISLTLICSWFLLVISSLVMFFLNFGYEKFYSPRDRIRIGFLESRLFGVFGDPNYAATASVVIIILSVYYFIQSDNKLSKLFLSSNIFLQYLYIVLSGSRTAEVIAYVSIAITISLLIFNLKRFESWSFLYKLVLSVISIVLTVFIVHVFIDLTKFFFTELLELLKSRISDNNLARNSQANSSLIRKDVAESNDVSNLRFSIWRSALEIFSTSWIYGVSPKNLIPYAREYLPNGFIAQNGFIAHNSYINVLVSTGVLGAVSFFGFCFKNLFQIVKNINWLKLKIDDFNFPYFLVVLSYAVFGLFNSEFVLEHTLGSLVFWLFLGRLMGRVKND